MSLSTRSSSKTRPSAFRPSGPEGGPPPRLAIDFVRRAWAYLERHGVPKARLDAELLLAHVMGITRLELYTRLDAPLQPSEVDAYRQALVRRAAREPLAYITGVKEFYGLPLAVGPGVLVPRPETEFLVELALEYLSGRRPEPTGASLVVDVGTGSGAIALAIAGRASGAQVVGVDRSPQALGYAVGNGRQLHARLAPGAAVHWVCSTYLACLRPRSADLVVSNPPYIPRAALARLAPEIRRYEPPEALDGGEDGLQPARALLYEARAVLRPGGIILLELGGPEQATTLQQSAGAAGAGYASIEVRRDPVTGAVVLVGVLPA